VKIIGTFGVVVTVSIALLQPAQGGSRGSARSFSPAPHFSASAGHFSGRPRSFSGGNARFYYASPRFSSQAAFRNRAYYAAGPRLAVNRMTALNPRGYYAAGPRLAANRMTALNSRGYSASGPRLAANRTAALRSQGFNNQGRVLARSSRNWDRNRDHFWHGHRCRFFNNAWVIFDSGFYPWGYGYGYYPYGAYSYYDGDYYDNGYASSDYSQEPAQSEYDSGNADSSVSQVQAALAREGYYRGSIDGSFGPATRNALRRYQRNHGLEVTGQIDGSVIEALGLR
jgi:hypothetical protein